MALLTTALGSTRPAGGPFLPCGISLREGSGPGETIVTLQNPGMIAEAFGAEALREPSAEAMRLLQAALGKIGTEV